MNKINLKGITAEAVTGVLILVVALVNAILQMLGFDTIPIANDEVSNIVSIAFLIIAALYNTYKNRNISKASQISQEITDSIKNGELLIEDVTALLEKCRKRTNCGDV